MHLYKHLTLLFLCWELVFGASAVIAFILSYASYPTIKVEDSANKKAAICIWKGSIRYIRHSSVEIDKKSDSFTNVKEIELKMVDSPQAAISGWGFYWHDIPQSSITVPQLGIRKVITRHVRFDVPILALWMIFGLLPMIVFHWRPARAYWRRTRGRCIHCGYDLRGTVSGRCSECGNCFKPE